MTIPEKLKELNDRATKLFDADGQLHSLTYCVYNWPLAEIMEWAGRFKEERLDIVPMGGHKVMQLLVQSSSESTRNIVVFFYSFPVKVTHPRIIEEL